MTFRYLFAIASAATIAACSGGGDAPSGKHVNYDADAAAGRALFIEKGCVICHSVNGVGGKAAPALDAAIGPQTVDPLAFAARMWRGAPAMIELQSLELGYTIHLTADEIASLAAFHSDAAEQKILSEDDLSAAIRDGLLNEQFWEVENWDEFLKNGQEE